MSCYIAKLAVFPRWKAPVPYETLPGVFTTIGEVFDAAREALRPMKEYELTAIATLLPSNSEVVGTGQLTCISVPSGAVRGYVIYVETGVEVGNWTTLDEAVDRMATEARR